MIHNRYLPLWLHRLSNGACGAAVFLSLSSIWFGESPNSWRYILSHWLMWSSVPVGIILATAATRFSMVEGVAGGEGYSELHTSQDKSPRLFEN